MRSLKCWLPLAACCEWSSFLGQHSQNEKKPLIWEGVAAGPRTRPKDVYLARLQKGILNETFPFFYSLFVLRIRMQGQSVQKHQQRLQTPGPSIRPHSWRIPPCGCSRLGTGRSLLGRYDQLQYAQTQLRYHPSHGAKQLPANLTDIYNYSYPGQRTLCHLPRRHRPSYVE